MKKSFSWKTTCDNLNASSLNTPAGEGDGQESWASISWWTLRVILTRPWEGSCCNKSFRVLIGWCLCLSSVTNCFWSAKEVQGTVISITTSLFSRICADENRREVKKKIKTGKNITSRQQDAHGPENDGWLDSGNGERWKGRRDFESQLLFDWKKNQFWSRGSFYCSSPTPQKDEETLRIISTQMILLNEETLKWKTINR